MLFDFFDKKENFLGLLKLNYLERTGKIVAMSRNHPNLLQIRPFEFELDMRLKIVQIEF